MYERLLVAVMVLAGGADLLAQGGQTPQDINLGDVVVATVTKVSEHAATNGNPPRVELKIHQVLRGDTKLDRTRARWTPVPHDIDAGNNETIAKAVEAWEARKFGGPKVGDKFVLWGMMARGAKPPIFDAYSWHAYPYSAEKRTWAVKAIRDHKEEARRDAAEREASARAAVDKIAPHAAGVCFAEVVEIKEYDYRPMDRNAGVAVKLRNVKGSGEFNEFLYITTAYGGKRQGPPPMLPDFLKPQTFGKGKTYWIAFASQHEYEKHPQGVVNYWRQGANSAAEAVLEEAVRVNAYRFCPRYDPKTKLVYGRVVEESAEGEEPQWRIQVQRAGKVLWEKVVPGTYSNRDYWVLDAHTETNYPGIVPPCGKMLVAETATRIGEKNEFGLPTQMVYVRYGFDPETGMRRCARVSRHQDGDVLLLYREYDPKSGEVAKETRGQ